jgi:uncharacterized protein (TIGR00369 family)
VTDEPLAHIRSLSRGLGRDGRPIPVFGPLGVQAALAVLTDVCCGVAVASAANTPGVTLTAQMRVEFVRPIPSDTCWIEGRGVVDIIDDESGLSRAELVDDQDELLAVASMRALRGRARPPEPRRGDGEPRLATPAAPGAERVVAQSAPVPAALALHDFVGVTSRHALRGGARWELAPSARTANSFGAVHGGVVGMLAQLVAADAEWSVLDADERLVPLDLVVNYFRSIPAGGEPVEAQAQVAHRGRRFLVAEGEIATANGATAARFSAGAQIRRAR